MKRLPCFLVFLLAAWCISACWAQDADKPAAGPAAQAAPQEKVAPDPAEKAVVAALDKLGVPGAIQRGRQGR